MAELAREREREFNPFILQFFKISGNSSIFILTSLSLMAKQAFNPFLLVLLVISISTHHSDQLEYSQSQALFRVQKLFHYPPALSSFHNTTDLCNIDPTPSFTLVCYEDSLTQLQINGQEGIFPLPQHFSTFDFFSTLTAFSSLRVLTLVSLGLGGPIPDVVGNLSSLEILNMSSNSFYGAIPEEVSHLKNLQTLILDHNRLVGQVPSRVSSPLLLAVLSLRNNSLNGSLPSTFSSMESLRILALSGNGLSGEIPDLHNLTNLQVLDLENNNFGPRFPNLSTRLVSLNFRRNKFALGIPEKLRSFYQLQKFDVSLNGFVGPFLPLLMSLPSMRYLDISGNQFTGMLLQNMSCSPELAFVNMSYNLLTGDLPTCLESESTVVLYSKNCLKNEDQEQRPLVFCHNEALAVDVLPPQWKHEKRSGKAKAALVFGVVGGVVGAVTAMALAFFLAFMKLQRRSEDQPPTAQLITEKASTTCNLKLLSDARYISQTMKMGASIPAYRTFALEELKNATNNFDNLCLLEDGSHCQIYKGRLADSTLVAIRRIKTEKRHSSQYYMPIIERISKLRHENLISTLGHCFECYPEDSSVCRIYLMFEFAVNGTLRDQISGHLRKTFSWTQRIVAAMEIMKGIQFLHTGIVPGVYSNNMKITDVQLDRDLHVKLSKYNLPLLSDDCGRASSRVQLPRAIGSNRTRGKDNEKSDVYEMGVILLELIAGRPITSNNEVRLLKDLVQVSLLADDGARRSIVDHTLQKKCSDESLRVMMDICIRCLSEEQSHRPSVEDVLWNLQFATQVQDSLRHDFQFDQDLTVPSFLEL
ncbi:probable inactive leucine-rich repeat receptor-like protein kinase At3g03770 isoform X2 [Rhodamnia argentea]|uniref:Probable inactive leucine-rich repeat receptor-like protein kinase At3g03770 isoform X2 n=1 Tax=Rhodamnia argentea TaxID=178133 RepID=A0A8B8QUY6_9MYRT|nr:probable inactive leucine-rich repeat receptor-like protein kinase At3g03770 isoform X2 [Rhodamnia argentea]